MTNESLHSAAFGKVQSESMSLLARFTSEKPLGGGAAKSKDMDKKVLDTWIDAVGMANVRKHGVNALEADWIATTSALFYVTPNAESVIPYPWSTIDEITVVKRRSLSSVLGIKLRNGEETFKLKTGKTSGDRLLEIWRTYGRNVDA